MGFRGNGVSLLDPYLIAILLLAAGLRLWGLDHSLPFVYNPDEANIMARSLSVARGLDPEYYLYPSFFFYFLFAAMGALFLFGRLVGRYDSLAVFQARFFEDPTDFYIVGRLVGVAAAVATIWLTFGLVRKHFGLLAARFAALFMAVCYFHVRDAHYLKHDVPSGLLLIVALLAIDRAIEHGTTARYLVAGASLGLAFATHYYMIFLAPTFVICHWAAERSRHFGRVLAAGAVSAVTFFLLSPFVLLHFGTALEHMRANRQVVIDRSMESGWTLFPSLPDYLVFMARQGLGVALLVLVVAGSVLIVRRGIGDIALWLTFPLMFLAFISYTFFAGRYLNPVLPCLVAAAGLAVASLARVSLLGTKGAVVIGLLAACQPLYYSIQMDRLFAGDDTRSLARNWLLERVPSGRGVALQSYSVPLPQSAESFRAALEHNEAEGELERRGKYAYLLDEAESAPVSYSLFYFGQGDELNRIYVGYDELADGLAPLVDLGVDLVVWRAPPGPSPPEIEALYNRLRREGRLLHTVSQSDTLDGDGQAPLPYLDNEDWPVSHELKHRGPHVEIWSLKKS